MLKMSLKEAQLELQSLKANGYGGSSKMHELQQSNESLLKDKLNSDLSLRLKTSEEAILRLQNELTEKDKQIQLSQFRIEEE